MATDACALCGLTLRYGNHEAVHGGRTLRFCCAGCKMVYSMLLEAVDAPSPERFRETELYRRCVEAGVVPAGEEDLERLQADPPDSRSEAPAPGGNAFELEQHFRVEGMWCPACSWVIQTALERMEGVIEARCNFAADRLFCRYDPVKTSPVQLAATVNQLGYGVFDPEDRGAARSRRGTFTKLMICLILSANVMMLSWALYTGFFTPLNSQAVAFIGWPAAFMATLVLAYGGAGAIRKAWYGLRHGAPGMEVLIILGAGSAYVYSVFNLIQGSLLLYFDTASMLVTLMLLGKMLEAGARSRVRQDLDSFLALQPRKVRLCSAPFPEGRFAAIDQLQVGDLFRVEPEEIVPADGRVSRGQGTINEAAVTGEPRPIPVGPGDTVVSGCRLLEGSLFIEALRTGQQTMLGQIVAIVQRSLARRTALESRTDRALAFFVPFITGLALLTGAVGYLLGLDPDQAIVRAVTVLVIACPCAMGIAIPLARVAGLAGAAKRGLLIRGFEVFERLPAMNTVVFDKTGTLTQGNWRLESIETLDGRSSADIVALVCGLEGDSRHVVARAVREYARGHGIEPADIADRQVASEGVRGLFQGRTLRAGSRRFVLDEGNTPEPGFEAENRQDPVLLSSVYVGAAGRLWAVLKFGDAMRPGMPSLIPWAHENIGDVHLISGDSPRATELVAARLGIAAWQGGLYPRDKEAYIERLQEAGHQVLMVGDGINDAPALARADMAVAVYSGAPLAREAAQVTLMRGSPVQLLDLLYWSRQVDRKVRQNIWCAFAYNLVSIPVAMSGLLNPLVAVTAMLMSSLTVIGNTLLLVRRKPFVANENFIETKVNP